MEASSPRESIPRPDSRDSVGVVRTPIISFELGVLMRTPHPILFTLLLTHLTRELTLRFAVYLQDSERQLGPWRCRR